MIYNNFKDMKLSSLGVGTMRLPTTKPDGFIDEEKAIELIRKAYEQGVNYFDTAYFYHTGNSERVVGKALSKYPRDTWYLADKMPGNVISMKGGKIHLELKDMDMEDASYNSLNDIFEHQLERCGVDYFDFYMLHNLAQSTYDTYVDEEIGIAEYLLEVKRQGRIRHLGFSCHSSPETLEKFLAYRNCYDFAMIQLNYLDWTLQEAGKKYDILTSNGLPVFVMEPVRGGKLTRLGQDAAGLLKAVRPNDTPASWAFRFLQSLPNVTVTLSGMTTMEQLEENLALFDKRDPLTDHEKDVLLQVADMLSDFIPCTACRYCCGVCPQGLDIPLLLTTYSEAFYDKSISSRLSWVVSDTLDTLPDGKGPMACIGCGACTPLCPQNIHIPETIAKFVSLLDHKK